MSDSTAMSRHSASVPILPLFDTLNGVARQTGSGGPDAAFARTTAASARAILVLSGTGEATNLRSA